MRRGPDDKEWQKVKRIVKKRDKDRDRILAVLSVKEVLLLRKNAPASQLAILDPAHYRGVGEDLSLCYVPEKLVLLNRFSHEHLDDGKSPITGDPITKAERQEWWERILKRNPAQYNYLKTNDILQSFEEE